MSASPVPSPGPRSGPDRSGRPRPFPARIERPWLAVAVTIVVVLVLPFAVLAGQAVSTGSGVNPLSSSQALLHQSAGEGVLLVVFAVIVTVFGGWRRVLAESASARPWWAVVALAAYVLVAVLTFLAPVRSGAAGYLGALVVAVIAVAVVEELVFRGILVSGLRRAAPEWVVWLVSTAVFALMHLLNQGEAAGGLYQVVTTFVLGSACYLARRVAGALWGAVLLHALSNGILGFRGHAAVGVPPLLVVAATAVIVVAAVMGMVVALRRAPQDRVHTSGGATPR
ncbi:CPBP family intramembrane glutamic endopeptidase [Curtobacterium sp. MCBD17_019]|uniref:CPBP family intramembrane glutamic endopeptidase n=1 Tax=Curtobacterium sp. MCBD17_019 TaxID=2175669 RepID=UPI000DA9D8B3|nr:CPBP family intramembrane glutamic endopeptidase [Curtobacterium sp. MCBD17_019]PZE78223.1 hypothetical protein DEI82_00090 [Curtobacterium sp. MCBD17_019]